MDGGPLPVVLVRRTDRVRSAMAGATAAPVQALLHRAAFRGMDDEAFRRGATAWMMMTIAMLAMAPPRWRRGRSPQADQPRAGVASRDVSDRSDPTELTGGPIDASSA